MTVDMSIALGCIEEARDVLRYLVRKSGPDLVGVYVDDIERGPELGAGTKLLGSRNALELVAQALRLVELSGFEVENLEKEVNSPESDAPDTSQVRASDGVFSQETA